MEATARDSIRHREDCEGHKGGIGRKVGGMTGGRALAISGVLEGYRIVRRREL